MRDLTDMISVTASAELRDEAEKFGYQLLDAIGEGNNLYHSVAFQLNRLLHRDCTADEIRQRVQEHRNKSRQLYKSFQECDALSAVYNIDIAIIRSDATEPKFFLQRHPSATIFLAYEVGFQYRPMIRNERKKPTVNLMDVIQQSKNFDKFQKVVHEKRHSTTTCSTLSELQVKDRAFSLILSDRLSKQGDGSVGSSTFFSKKFQQIETERKNDFLSFILVSSPSLQLMPVNEKGEVHINCLMVVP